ncbi:hypothetical protein C0389_06970 [bacterium]|nr:hypothetical protein [bacterium]
MLIFVILFQAHFYNYFVAKTKMNSQALQTGEISLMQFTTTNIDFIPECNLPGGLKEENFLINQIKYYWLHKSRRDRVNFSQKLLKLS